MKRLPLLAFVLFICVFILASVRTAQSAEIININYKYKIAFADLTEKDVKAGSLVIVTMPDGTKASLKVVETYPVMAKLTIADGAGALTEEQFASIPVGSQVVPADRAETGVRAKTPAEKIPKPVAAAGPQSDSGPDDSLAHVESYSPGGVPGSAQKEPAQNFQKPAKSVSSVGIPMSEGARATVVQAREEAFSADTTPQASQLNNDSSRSNLLEERLDQMMANNVKLVENLTQLLSEKNAAEAAVREKEAATVSARVKAEELASANSVMAARIKDLEASVATLEREKAAQKKDNEELNLKLGELKKKLAKMVEIVNTNMKAYEK